MNTKKTIKDESGKGRILKGVNVEDFAKFLCDDRSNCTDAEWSNFVETYRQLWRNQARAAILYIAAHKGRK